MWFFPLAAAGVSALFAALLAQQWLQRGRHHYISWALALLMFAIGSFAASIGMLDEWSAFSYRIFYLFGAILNVPLLALGTTYLLAGRIPGHIAAGVIAVAAIFAAGAVFTAAVDPSALHVSGVPSSARAFAGNEGLRLVSRYYSTVGFTVVVAGALWSAWRLARRRLEELKRLAVGNILIAAGTAVVAGASRVIRLSQSEGAAAIFAVGLLAGVVTMFVGFLRTRSKPSVNADSPSPAPEEFPVEKTEQ